jgi:DNA-binding transcriptional regulator GbsR (MarR family)
MTGTAERIFTYMYGRVTPMTIEELAIRFGRSESQIAKLLRLLEEEGKVKRIIGRRHQFYVDKLSGETHAIKEETRERKPVAVSKSTPSIQPSKPAADERPKVIWPQSTWKTSYPHVRGYDD